MRDRAIDKDGNLIFSGYDSTFTTDNSIYAAQKLQIVLRTFFGEWYLDASIGIPYFSQILGKKTTMNYRSIGAIFKQQILSVNVVSKLLSFQMSIDKSIRKLYVTFKAKLSTGQTVTREVII